MAVAQPALVGTILLDDLPNVLRDQVRFESKSRHVGKSVGEDFHLLERRKLIDHSQRRLVRLSCLTPDVLRDWLGLAHKFGGNHEARTGAENRVACGGTVVYRGSYSADDVFLAGTCSASGVQW